MKKLISILSVMVVLLSMTACGKNGDESKNTTTTTTSTITTTQSENEQPEIEPLPVPEGGWTAEELAKTIRINGELISIPFTIDSLGEGYTYSEESDCIEYNGNKKAFVVFKDDIVDFQVSVEGLAAFSDYTDNSLTINGIGLGSTRNEAIKALGEPSEIVESKFGSTCKYYTLNDNSIYLFFKCDENDKITFISYYFE